MSPTFPIEVDVLSMGSDWRVQKNGSHVSNHRKKKRAVEKAKRIARNHDGPAKVRIQAQTGRWQNTIEY